MQRIAYWLALAILLKLKVKSLEIRYLTTWRKDFGEKLVYVNTVESEKKNIPIHLLIFGIFSRGYVLITDLKDLNFYT